MIRNLRKDTFNEIKTLPKVCREWPKHCTLLHILLQQVAF